MFLYALSRVSQSLTLDRGAHESIPYDSMMTNSLASHYIPLSEHFDKRNAHTKIFFPKMSDLVIAREEEGHEAKETEINSHWEVDSGIGDSPPPTPGSPTSSQASAERLYGKYTLLTENTTCMSKAESNLSIEGANKVTVICQTFSTILNTENESGKNIFQDLQIVFF